MTAKVGARVRSRTIWLLEKDGATLRAFDDRATAEMQRDRLNKTAADHTVRAVPYLWKDRT